MHHSSIWSWLLMSLVLLLLYSVALAVYRILFHPLRHLPGPKLAAATYWYEFYQDILTGPCPGQNVFHIQHLHDIYGPVVRVSPDEVSFRNADWIDITYGNPKADKWHMAGAANASPGSMSSAMSRDLHRLRRGAVSPYFSKRSVNELEGMLRKKVGLLCRGVDGFMKRKETLNVRVAFTAFAFDSVCEYCFGRSWNCLEQQDFHPEVHCSLKALMENVPIARQFPIIARLSQQLPIKLLMTFSRIIGLFMSMKGLIREEVEKVLELHGSDNLNDLQEKGNKTVFHGIVASDIPMSEKSVERLTDEGFVLLYAGTETVAGSLSNLIYRLHANPEWLSKTQAELDAVMPDSCILADLNILEKLPILTAVIKETWRITPLVTGRFQPIDPTNPIKLGQYTIPPNTPISTSLPHVHLNADIFSNPTMFDPSRWIVSPSQPQKEVTRLSRYFNIFSKGPRICIGMNLAQAEVLLCAAAFIRRFKVELSDVVKERDVDVVRDGLAGLPGPGAKGINVKVLGLRE